MKNTAHIEVDGFKFRYLTERMTRVLRVFCIIMICGWVMNIDALDASGLPSYEVIDGITYEWKNSLDEEAFKRISVEAVYQCYKNIPAEELLSGSFKIDESIGLKGSLEKWTDEYIQELSQNLEQPDCFLQIVTARKGEIPVGFAIFEMKTYPTSVYLSELIVDPTSQRNGVGKNLVFSVLRRFPELEKIVLVTRKANFQATAFYPAIGFASSDYMHLGYDPEIYGSFEFINRSAQ